MFHDITGDAAFLSKDIYGDQIVRFDFRPSSLPDESLRRSATPSAGSLLDTAYDEAPGVYFRKEGDSTVVYGMNMTAPGGATPGGLPAERVRGDGHLVYLYADRFGENGQSLSEGNGCARFGVRRPDHHVQRRRFVRVYGMDDRERDGEKRVLLCDESFDREH